MGAVILGFDVKCPTTIEKRVEDAGVPIKLHKLIYRFCEDIENLIHDVELKDAEKRGKGFIQDVIGQATVQEIFNISVGKSGTKISVAGSRILSGELHASYKYRLVRGEDVIADDLKLSALKHVKKNVSKLEKGQECGISFANYK